MAALRLSYRQEERWVVAAHLVMLLNLVTGLMGIIAALAIYLIFKRRSAFIAFHALQSLLYQLVFWLGGSVLAITLFILGRNLGVFGVVLEILAFFLMLVPSLSLVYSLLAASQIRRGNEFYYPLTGNWAREIINR
jgi:uncharacterized protein